MEFVKKGQASILLMRQGYDKSFEILKMSEKTTDLKGDINAFGKHMNSLLIKYSKTRQSGRNGLNKYELISSLDLKITDTCERSNSSQETNNGEKSNIINENREHYEAIDLSVDLCDKTLSMSV